MGKISFERIREFLSVKISNFIERELGDPLNKKYFKFLRNRIIFWGILLIIFWLGVIYFYITKEISKENIFVIIGISFALYIGILIAHTYALALSYVLEDAKLRSMPPTLWFLVCLLVPYLLGFVLYLLVRKPLPLICPKCYQPAPGFSKYCPNCGYLLRTSCPKCDSPVPEKANFCPQCGSSLKS